MGGRIDLEGHVISHNEVDAALREHSLVDPGVEAPFQRIAQLTVAATRAPICVIAFGSQPHLRVKGYAGPSDENPSALVPRELHEVLVEGRREVVARGEVAGCPIRTSSGRVIGAVWLRTPSPRTWTPDAIELIETSVELVRCELDARARRRPDAKVALILESISDACVFLDPSWRYTYMNRKAGEIFARDPALMVGKHIWTEFPEGVGQPFYHAYHRAMREQVPIQLEEYYPPYDRWFENRIYPSQEGLAIFFQDVTERKRAELAIERVAKRAERERELRAQAERLAHLGFWTWDILRNHITWSDELYRIYGLDRRVAEASFEAYLARLHPQDRDSVRSLIEDSLRDRTPMSFEERIVRPDGEVRWLHTWGNVALREDGEVSEMFGVCIDVTEMVETTEDLRRKEAWLEAALESSRVALWEWEVRENIVHWSTGAEKVLGLPEGALGTSFDAYLASVHEDERDALIEALRVSVDTTADLELEHRRVLPDGALAWAVVQGCVTTDDAGRVVRLLGTVLDVTERRAAEDERRELLDELAHAQKMEAIGRLSASVAHDINNMLTVVRGAQLILQKEPALGALSREALASMNQAYERAAGLTSQLLAVSRKQELCFEPLDLNELIQAACGMYERILPPNIELELHLEPGLPRVLADRGRIDQVLLNLVINANDAMPSGGVLCIATTRDDDRAVMTVSDTGVGMSPEVRKRIFEPFYTTKGSRGTGLGLATVYGIVRQSNGEIEVESAPGEGSRFTIRIPYAA